MKLLVEKLSGSFSAAGSSGCVVSESEHLLGEARRPEGEIGLVSGGWLTDSLDAEFHALSEGVDAAPTTVYRLVLHPGLADGRSEVRDAVREYLSAVLLSAAEFGRA